MLLNMLRRVKRDAGLVSAFMRMCRPPPVLVLKVSINFFSWMDRGTVRAKSLANEGISMTQLGP